MLTKEEQLEIFAALPLRFKKTEIRTFSCGKCQETSYCDYTIHVTRKEFSSAYRDENDKEIVNVEYRIRYMPADGYPRVPICGGSINLQDAIGRMVKMLGDLGITWF